jgi:hypothetical protein
MASKTNLNVKYFGCQELLDGLIYKILNARPDAKELVAIYWISLPELD